MSAYRDDLTSEQRELYDEAIKRAAIILGRARSLRDSLPVDEAARAAYIPGGPSVEEIAELIRAQRERARARLAEARATEERAA